jgi:hypothetical protein
VSRAEYQRQRRAAQRTPLPDHRCEGCGTRFTPKRTDARFCTAACRAAKWRPLRHHAVLPYRGHKELCSHLDEMGEFCHAPAVYRHEFVVNETRRGKGHLLLYEYLCAEHIAEHHPEGLTIGEPLKVVMARNAKAARARHGTPAG